MPAESAHGKISVGDVSGTFIVGACNRVTTGTHGPEREQPYQQNSAADQAAVFAVENGTMHVAYNAGAEHEEHEEEGEGGAGAPVSRGGPAAPGPGRSASPS